MRARPLSGADHARGRAAGAHAQHAATGAGIQRLPVGGRDAARRRAAASAPARHRAHLRPSAHRRRRGEVRYALSTAGLTRIRAFLSRDTLLAFDIDGTLAPIVDRPWDARVPGDVQRGLKSLASHAPVAIVTGRAVEDARPM